jgi:hypothetical protein
MERTTLQRGGLSVRDYGGGGRPLVLIHGPGFSQKSWANLIAALGGRHRIITFDQRGHGASTQSWDYSWSSFVGHREALCRPACPAQYLLATEEGPGPAGPPAQAARHATAERAVTLNPSVRVQRIDAGHAMARARARELAKAVMEMEPKS